MFKSSILILSFIFIYLFMLCSKNDLSINKSESNVTIILHNLGAQNLHMPTIVYLNDEIFKQIEWPGIIDTFIVPANSNLKVELTSAKHKWGYGKYEDAENITFIISECVSYLNLNKIDSLAYINPDNKIIHWIAYDNETCKRHEYYFTKEEWEDTIWWKVFNTDDKYWIDGDWKTIEY